MTVNAVLVPVLPGAKKANGAPDDSAPLGGDEGQLFAAMLGQWLFALEGAQGQTFGEENPNIVPAGKEANSGIVTGGLEGTTSLLMARGFAQTGMYGQASMETGSELDQYKERIVKLLGELNGEIIVSKTFNLLPVQSPGLAGVSEALVKVSNDLAPSGQGDKVLVGNTQAEKSFAGDVQEEQATVQGSLEGKSFSRDGTGKNVAVREEIGAQSRGIEPQRRGIEPQLRGIELQRRGIAPQPRGIEPQPQDIKVDLRQLSDSRQNTAITNTGAFDPNVEPDPAHDASVLGGKSRVSQIINKSTNEDKGSLGESVQSAVTTVRFQSRNLRASGSLPVDAAGRFEQDITSPDDGQVSAENRPGSVKISSISLSAGEDMTDNRPQSGMSQTKGNGQDSAEALPNFGEGRIGSAESNSARGNIVPEALNGSKGPLPIWDRIAEAVREHRNSPEVKELQLQLHPAELGKIKVLMHWQDGQVNLQVQASESATGALLQHSLSDLRQALEQAGVSCGLLQSELSGGSSQQQPEFFAPASARPGQDEEEKVSLPEYTYMAADRGSRINYMA